MKPDEIQEAIRNVDAELVKEAEEFASPKVRTGKKKWFKIGGVGVGAAACVVAGVLIVSSIINDKTYGLLDKPANNGAYWDGDIVSNGSIGGNKDEYSGIFDIDGFKPELAPGTDSSYPEAMLPSPIETGGSHTNDQYAAGTLTAKAWSDGANFADWRKLVNDNKWFEYADARKLFSDNAVTVKINADGKAVFNCAVALFQGDKILFEARTDINGKTQLFYNITGKNEKPDTISVDGKKIALDGKTEIEVELGKSSNVKELDLMFMIDTTGSMGDELNYIKEELKDMVTRIAKAGQSVSIRVSVNFYRDEQDEYVVRYFDFRTDIDECVNQIKSQNADGGGDWPEAVHIALDNVVNGHTWRENAVKMCIMVFDAPPHSESEINGINDSLRSSIVTAAKLGIRIVPVVCSGIDAATEYFSRSMAVMTGGTYVTLTNDSGIGGTHHESTIGDTDVEYLNECLIRIVSEACGIQYSAIKIPNLTPEVDNDRGR